MVSKERQNEICKLYQRRQREWRKISKIFLDILNDDKIEKVYKTDEELKKKRLLCNKLWIEKNRQTHNILVLNYMNNKNRLNQELKRFRNMLIN